VPLRKSASQQGCFQFEERSQKIVRFDEESASIAAVRVNDTTPALWRYGAAVTPRQPQGAEDSRDWLSPLGRRTQRQRRCRFNYPEYRQQRISSSLALDRLGNSPDNENRVHRVKYWEIIADKIAASGLAEGECTSRDEPPCAANGRQ
jgi:hypothetical protein